MEILADILIAVAILFLLAGVGLYSPQAVGKSGETYVRKFAARNLPVEDYHQLHDVTLPTSYGSTQIDHILVSRFGIFVIETKNMKGWIFGGVHQYQWTQVLFKASYKFQNPLQQNRVHVDALQAILKVPYSLLHSVVVFVGDSEFKAPMPANVLSRRQLIPYIRSFDVEVLRESEVRGAVSLINRVRLLPSKETDQHHVLSLRARPRPSSERKCPICGSSMVLRSVRKGFRAGSAFWGCSKYPRCKGIRN